MYNSRERVRMFHASFWLKKNTSHLYSKNLVHQSRYHISNNSSTSTSPFLQYKIDLEIFPQFKLQFNSLESSNREIRRNILLDTWGRCRDDYGTWTRPIGGDTTRNILMVALRKSSWLRLVSCSASEMLALPWPVFRRTFRLMLPTSLRQSCPEPVAPALDALPAPPPPPPPWVGASWPSDDFEGLCSRLDRGLATPRPSLAADADTVPLVPGPATGCEPPGQPFTFASVPSAPANLSTGPPPPLGPVAPPWPNEPIA